MGKMKEIYIESIYNSLNDDKLDDYYYYLIWLSQQSDKDISLLEE